MANYVTTLHSPQSLRARSSDPSRLDVLPPDTTTFSFDCLSKNLNHVFIQIQYFIIWIPSQFARGSLQSQSPLSPSKATLNSITFIHRPTILLSVSIAFETHTMAPIITYQYRDNGDDDDSDSIYNHPVIMFFGLLLLCFCVMAPMFWMLWMMRNDSHDSKSSFHPKITIQH